MSLPVGWGSGARTPTCSATYTSCGKMLWEPPVAFSAVRTQHIATALNMSAAALLHTRPRTALGFPPCPSAPSYKMALISAFSGGQGGRGSSPYLCLCCSTAGERVFSPPPMPHTAVLPFPVSLFLFQLSCHVSMLNQPVPYSPPLSPPVPHTAVPLMQQPTYPLMTADHQQQPPGR